MRQLGPDAADVDPVEAYSRLGRAGHRPRVRLYMIASATAPPTWPDGPARRRPRRQGAVRNVAVAG
jgi:hypothetical protein